MQPQVDARETKPLTWLLLTLFGCTAWFAYVLVRWPDNFFADDSYFYFQVAWNFAHGHGSTFNGLMPTNGYHPLWMLICACIYLAVESKDAAVHAIGGVIAVLNLLTLAGVTVLLRRAGTRASPVAWLLLLPFLFTSQLGTEGALSAACVCGTLLAAYRFAQQHTMSNAFVFAFAAAVAVLSRLDNIFIVAALSCGLVVRVVRESRRDGLRVLAAAAFIVLGMWGAYLWSNHHYFGMWQPISGLLKSHSRGEHRLGSNLPHVAILDLLVIALGLPVLWRFHRDLFLRAIELPCALGVVTHAFYILFFMSTETRWSWYYTIWTVLAAILLARVVGLWLDGRPALQLPAVAACAGLLLTLGWRNSRLRGHDDLTARDPGFQANVIERSHLATLLAFDKPGRIAYYSTARIIPLDGLMGDLRFQQELASAGIAELARRYGVDGFIGPPQPMGADGKREFCDAVFLSATRFLCATSRNGDSEAIAAKVYARLSGTPAGIIALPHSQLVWNAPGYVAVWRVEP